MELCGVREGIDGIVVVRVCVVIQGPVVIDPARLEEAWGGVPVVWSTWVGEKVGTGSRVVYSEKPKISGPKNVCLQAVSSYNGLREAKRLGFTHAIKWRSDQMPTNAGELLKNFSKNNISFLFWHDNQRCKCSYFVDYCMFGSVDYLLGLWNPEFYGDVKRFSVPELYVTSRVEELGGPVGLVGGELTKNNDIIWERKGKTIRLSSYLQDASFKKVLL